MAVLKVATCQFPVSADIGANLLYIKRQIGIASKRGAGVAHFPEGSLSGYAGSDFETFAGFDWDRLQEATAEVGSTRASSECGRCSAPPTGSAAPTNRTTACMSSAIRVRSSRLRQEVLLRRSRRAFG